MAIGRTRALHGNRRRPPRHRLGNNLWRWTFFPHVLRRLDRATSAIFTAAFVLTAEVSFTTEILTASVAALAASLLSTAATSATTTSTATRTVLATAA